ncbi:MAG: tetratricopeptide repeat protein [Chitinophagales bacterium]
MRVSSLLGMGFALLFTTFQIYAQSDYVVFERAYNHYIQQKHSESIRILEEQLNYKLVTSPKATSFLQISQQSYNQGLLLFLQLRQNPTFSIQKELFLFSPTELAHYLGKNAGAILWQKARIALINKQYNYPLQQNIAEGFMLAGMAAIQVNDLEKAVHYFEKTLELDSNHKAAKLGMAMIQFRGGDTEIALELLNDFSEQFPDDHFADLCKADIYQSLEYYDRAAKSLDIFLGHLPCNEDFLTFDHYHLLMTNGQNKMFLRNYDVAEQYFSQAIELNDESVAAFVARAEARAYKLKLKEAEEDLFIARSLDNANSRVFHMLGYVKMLQWQNEEALSYFSKSIVLQDNIKEAYIHRSSIRSVLGDIEGAIEDLNQVIEMDENADKSYAVRAYLKSRKGNLKEALADYNRAVELSPSNASHFIGRAAIKEQLEMEESYLDDLDKAISLSPQNYYPYHAKGAWYQNKKENDKALEAYNQAIQIAPDEAGIYLDRGSVHLAKGNPKGALQDLGTVISLEPKNGQAYFLQGILYFLLEKNLKACASMSKAKSLGFEEAEESLVSFCGK